MNSPGSKEDEDESNDFSGPSSNGKSPESKGNKKSNHPSPLKSNYCYLTFFNFETYITYN